MLSPTCVLWDVGHPLYTCGSIFIIALIIWQVKRRRRELRLGSKRICGKCHRRIKPKPRDKTSRAKTTSQDEAKKLQKLLSVMKSQSWLPQEGSVRRLLCVDPGCQICNGMALEIQQLLRGEDKTFSPLLQPSQSSSCPEMSRSSLSFEQSQENFSQQSRDLSPAFVPTPSQLTDKKSLTQPAALSVGDVNVQHSLTDHLQEEQKFYTPNESPCVKSLSSSHKEHTTASQQKRKNSIKHALKNQEASEVDVENKMTFFSHWINPECEVKCEQHKEPTHLSKNRKVDKPRTKEEFNLCLVEDKEAP